MAKLKGKAKAAFLRRMAAGRRKARGGVGTRNARRAASGRSFKAIITRTNPSRSKRRKVSRGRNWSAFSAEYARAISKGYTRAEARSHALSQSAVRPRARRSKVVRRMNPAVLLANPGFAGGFGWGGVPSVSKPKRKKRTKRKGTSTMAKRRKARKSRKGRSKARRARRRVYTVRPSKRTRTIYINPGKKRRSRRRKHKNPRRIRRHRNPGRGGLMTSIKAAFTPLIAGTLTGMACAALDTALSKYPTGKKLAKVGGAVVIAMFGRRYPRAACAAIGALAATEGYNLGSKLVGGMPAIQKPEQVPKALSTMGDSYPEIGALLEGGVGALLEGVPNEVSNVANYAASLSNMAGDDDE